MEQRQDMRPMRSADLAWVSQQEQVIYRFPWSRKNFADCLQSGYDAWIITVAGQDAGYAVIMQSAGEAELLNLAVLPAQQGRGIGRLAVNWLLDWARRQSLSAIYLEVRASNIVARRLYEAAGFNEMHVRRNYYPTATGREDAIIMGVVL